MKLIKDKGSVVTIDIRKADFKALFRLIGCISQKSYEQIVGEEYDTIKLYTKMFKLVEELGLKRGIDY